MSINTAQSSILAIDTSGDACSVALVTPDAAEQKLSLTPREHTQRLMPMVQNLLRAHDLNVSVLDAIAVSIGPGSFTGLRIGLSVAQGLAYGADVPIVPISTLRTMAHGALRKGLATQGQCVVPVIDARMNEVYWSAYTCTPTGVEVIAQEAIASPHMLAEQLRIELLPENAKVVGVGSGWRYDDLLQLPISSDHTCNPEAIDVAQLAQQHVAQGVILPPEQVVPVYLREEVNWQKRTRIRPS